jgi:uncharacterized protein (TIGR04222 family)
MEHLLLEKLRQFDLDGGVPYSFSRRLARDNGWSHEFALRVCEEYKKFLYLACTTGHVVSPSEEVDQAWHLHLTYTRSYWEELCPKVLGMPLHHDPSRGRKSEAGKFEALYEQTLASYGKAFDAPPPLDIWPSVEVRFGEVAHFRRINLKRHYVVARPNFSWSNLKFASALALVAVLAGCSATGSLNPYDWYGGEFLAFFWCLIAAYLLLNWGIRTAFLQSDDEDFLEQPLDPYILARLNHSSVLGRPSFLPVSVALCSLRLQRIIERNDQGVIVPVPGASVPAHTFERLVLNKLGAGKYAVAIEYDLRALIEPLDDPLIDAGLIFSRGVRKMFSAVVWLPLLLLFLIGYGKMSVGLQRDRPIGFLILSCGLVYIAACVLSTSVPFRTRRGERYLQRQRAVFPQARAYDPRMPVAELVLGAALWGHLGLREYGFSIFDSSGGAAYGGSGGGGSSDSDSGGGDGGGGGCGGCGGGGGD